nr:hypothetical protein [Pseudonocardia sp. ICBG601]
MAMFMLAGFESATFFGPETRRPLVTVTRVVLWTPLLCGALLSFAAWASWTGRATTLVAILSDPGASGAPTALVVALHAGLACSYLASPRPRRTRRHGSRSPSGGAAAARALATVHRRWRTPHRAVVGIVAVVLLGGLLADLAPAGTDAVRHLVRALVTLMYVLVAVAAVAFLLRIREHTRPVLVLGCTVAVLGGPAGAAAARSARHPRGTGAAVALAVCCAVGPVWWRFLRRHPDRLARIGVFDQPGSDDVLPGADDFVPDARGRRGWSGGARAPGTRRERAGRREPAPGAAGGGGEDRAGCDGAGAVAHDGHPVRDGVPAAQRARRRRLPGPDQRPVRVRAGAPHPGAGPARPRDRRSWPRSSPGSAAGSGSGCSSPTGPRARCGWSTATRTTSCPGNGRCSPTRTPRPWGRSCWPRSRSSSPTGRGR